MAQADIVQEERTESTHPQPDPYLKDMMDRITEAFQRPPEHADVERPSEQRREDGPRENTTPAPARQPRLVDFGQD